VSIPLPIPSSGLRARIHRGELLVGTFVNLGAPQGVEIAGRAGLDWLLLDLEHGAGTEADLLTQLYAAEVTGVPAVVRVEIASRLRIGRVLDLGAAGVMIPRVEVNTSGDVTIEELRGEGDEPALTAEALAKRMSDRAHDDDSA